MKPKLLMFPTTLKFESLGNLEFDLPSCLIKVELSETKIFYASKTLKQLLTLLTKSLNIVFCFLNRQISLWRCVDTPTPSCAFVYFLRSSNSSLTLSLFLYGTLGALVLDLRSLRNSNLEWCRDNYGQKICWETFTDTCWSWYSYWYITNTGLPEHPPLATPIFNRGCQREIPANLQSGHI